MSNANARKQKLQEQDQQARNILTATTVTHMETIKGTLDLFLDTLIEIGCQYDLNDGEEGKVHFAYQGEHFFVAADNDRPYVIIYDYAWGSVELYDIDEVSRLRKAINEANCTNSVTTVFTIDETSKTMDVHCKTVILFIPQIPNLDHYLKVELNEFFRAHRAVENEMTRLRGLEAENKVEKRT